MLWWPPFVVAGIAFVALTALAWRAPHIFLRSLMPLMAGVLVGGLCALVWTAAVLTLPRSRATDPP